MSDLRNLFQQATAQLLAKFSPAAQARKAELAKTIYALAIKSVELSISELSRLTVNGQDFSEAIISYRLVKQQLESECHRNAIDIGVMNIVLVAGKCDEAKAHLSPEVLSRKKELNDQMTLLVCEDLEITSTELGRLALQTPGLEGRGFAEAGALLQVVRTQLQTEEEPAKAGVARTLVDIVTRVAQDEVREQGKLS